MGNDGQDQTMTSQTNKIIDAAVDRMQARRPAKFEGKRYDTAFTFGYHTLGEKVASLVGHRIAAALAPYLDNPEDDSVLGDMLRKATRTVIGTQDVDVIDVCTDMLGDDNPRFMMTISKDNEDRGDRGLIENVSIKVLEADIRTEMSGYQNTILEASLSSYPEYVIGTGGVFQSDFRSLVDFCEAITTALPDRAPQLSGEGESKMFVDPEYMALIASDGGLPGRNTMAAVDTYFENAARLVLDWAAKKVLSVVENQKERGFVWGRKFLNFNDLDNSCSAVDTDVPGRAALFHQNISLINPYNTSIAWVDTDDGEPTTICVHMVHYSDSVGAAVSMLQAGTLEPTVTFDLRTRELIKADNFAETELVSMFSTYLSIDDRMFVEGEMDQGRYDLDECVHTDFSEFYEGPEDELAIVTTSQAGP